MSGSIEKKWCAVIWKTKNFSCWTTDIYQDLRSPTFKTPATGSRLLEMKLLSASKKNGEFIVRVHRIWGEPIFADLVCQLSVLAADGTVQNLTAINVNEPSAMVISDFTCILPETESKILVPEDTLTLCLKIQHYEMVNVECFTRTVLHQDNCLWKIPSFSGALPVVCKNFQLAYHQFVLNLYKTNSSPQSVEIQVSEKFGASQSFLSYRFFIVNADGQELAKYNYNDFVTSYSGNDKYIKITLQDDFVVNDVLFLQWQFTVGVGEFLYENKDVVPESPFTLPTLVKKNLPTPPASSCSLRKDLLCMYKERKFCDATLKAEDTLFPVHKSILCARSPVFYEMFDSDMEERRTNVVDIPDIEPDTVERMLMFLYTDHLEEIHFDEAYSLYYAADKYAILTLKELCLSILKAELSVSNVCHALVLADNHQDESLMQSVQDFIWSNDEVISTNEWKVLEESRPLLTIKLYRDMHFKMDRS